MAERTDSKEIKDEVRVSAETILTQSPDEGWAVRDRIVGDY
jgi:hypothetical protein